MGDDVEPNKNVEVDIESVKMKRNYKFEKPNLRIAFDSKSEFQNLYSNYAWKERFGEKTTSSNMGENGKLNTLFWHVLILEKIIKLQKIASTHSLKKQLL